MASEMAFALKISAFNALGVAVTVGVPTYLDPRQTSNVEFGDNRHYPLGYWVCLFAVPVFFVSYRCLCKQRSLASKVTVPAGVLFFCGMVSLWNFTPGFPHGGILLWIPLYTIACAVSCWMHFSEGHAALAGAPELDTSIRLERVKEGATLWRTVAVSMMIGYAAVLIPASNLNWELARQTVTNPSEIMQLGLFSYVELALFSIYVLVGPVLEAFGKANRTADLMFSIKKG